MPYLQLDAPCSYSINTKRRLARRAADLYAEIMQTSPDKIVVAFRELREGSLWRCGHQEPQPGAVLMCDIRRGRPSQQRAQLADALLNACADELGLDPDRLSVVFTQHAGDEVFRSGSGLGRDWTPAEASTG